MARHADPPRPVMVEPYADATQYRARNGSSEADDAIVTGILIASSRTLDRRLGWCPGGLGPIPARAVTFWPDRRPSRILRLRDTEGHLWPLRPDAGPVTISVDYSGTGEATHTWTLADEAWIVPQPDGGDRPARSLRIHESHLDAIQSVWPSDPGNVTITSPWGHNEIVDGVRELVIHVTREIRDGHAGGAAAVYAALEAGIDVNAQMGRLWRSIEKASSAGRLAHLGVVSSAGAARRR